MVARSAYPVIALAALVVALAGLPLRWAEMRSVAQAMGQQKSTVFLNETESPEFRALRDHLREERQALLRS